MSHARTQIRAAVVAALGATGYPVVPGRVYPESQTLPALAVSMDTERVDPPTDSVMDSTDQHRQVVLTVEGRVDAVTALDDALDAVCLEVERALAVDVTFGGLVEWTEIRETEYERTDEGARPIGVATMRYEIDYRVDSSDPEAIRS